MLPAVVVVSGVIIIPLVHVLVSSFTDRFFGYATYEFIGIDNYLATFDDPLFWQALINSIKLTFLVGSFSVGLGLALALLLSVKRRGGTFFRLIFFLPWVFPSMVITFTFRWLYNDMYGYLNHLLLRFGLLEEGVNLLADQNLAWIGIILPMVWSSFPFSMLIFLAALQSIDGDIYDAAKLDGAGKWQTFWFITFPLLLPACLLSLLLQFIWEFASFDYVYLLTRGGPADSTLTLSLYIYQKAFEYKLIGLASAGAVLLFLITLLFSMIYLWLSGKRLGNA